LKHQEQLAHPPSALRKIESRNVLGVESLNCHAATILESSNVNQPLEVANELLTDEVIVHAINSLIEDVLERAAITGIKQIMLVSLENTTSYRAAKNLLKSGLSERSVTRK